MNYNIARDYPTLRNIGRKIKYIDERLNKLWIPSKNIEILQEYTPFHLRTDIVRIYEKIYGQLQNENERIRRSSDEGKLAFPFPESKSLENSSFLLATAFLFDRQKKEALHTLYGLLPISGNWIYRFDGRSYYELQIDMYNTRERKMVPHILGCLASGLLFGEIAPDNNHDRNGKRRQNHLPLEDDDR
jgi:hypothetical protein